VTQPLDDAEHAIERMVRLFYERGRADPVLAPIFNAAIHDWEAHIALVSDFWSGMVHGTQRYRGNAYAPHAQLVFDPEAFAHWLAAFEGAAAAALAPDDAAKAIRIARQMAESFKVGLFPFIGADGRPSRRPAGK
jgi:hemoglobin